MVSKLPIASCLRDQSSAETEIWRDSAAFLCKDSLRSYCEIPAKGDSDKSRANQFIG